MSARLPLAAIDPPDHPVRRIRASLDDDEALRRSMAELGLIEPILVTARGDRYSLIAGERRLAAAAALGWAEIAAEIAPRHDEAWTTAAAAAENMVRAAMSPVDQWRIMARLQGAGYTLAGAGATLGLSERAARKLDRLGALHPDIVAALERGDWPREHELHVIANATPEAQARALALKNARLDGGPDRGCIVWWRVAAALKDARIPVSRAIFDIHADTQAARAVTWTEDLFAEPGRGEELFTTDLPAFLAAQREALTRETPPKGVTLRVVELGRNGAPKIPAGLVDAGLTDQAKAKKGQTIVAAVDPSNGVVRRIACKPKPGAKPAAPAKAGKPTPDPDTTPDATAAAPATPAPRPGKPAAAPSPADPPDPPEAAEARGISRRGLEIVAAEKTAALRACLRDGSGIGPDDIIRALVLVLVAAPNVTVRGFEDVPQMTAITARLVDPAGHLLPIEGAELDALALDVLARCLWVGGPNAEGVVTYRTDSGPVAEWIGHHCNAAAHLQRFDTAEFLAAVPTDMLRAAAVAAGDAAGKLPKQAGALRKALTDHLPLWRPAAAHFGAPGPRRPHKES